LKEKSWVLDLLISNGWTDVLTARQFVQLNAFGILKERQAAMRTKVIRFLALTLVFIVLVPMLTADVSAAVDAVTIIKPEDATLAEHLAAKEIRRYFYLQTGKLLPIIESDKQLPSKTSLIVVGQKDRGIIKALTKKDARLKSSVASLGHQQYQIKTLNYKNKRTILITGGDSIGTLYAAYRLAEHLGVRFYLHGDTVPDAQITLKLPDVDEKNKPLFNLRGIQPFHDFVEGPDWWNTDDYKAIIAQLPKLRMNFIGLHTYPEGGVGPEPTVWIGLAEDVEPDGKVRFSSASGHRNTLDSSWFGYAAKNTSEFNFGAAQLFERDGYGAEVMFGLMPSTAPVLC